jgi:hypothetical protein
VKSTTCTSALEDLSGLDVSGSQAQILAVAMGLRELEEQLRRTPFKKLVALSIRALNRQRKIKVSPGLLASDTMLENVAKGVGMPAIYGGRPSNIADGCAAILIASRRGSTPPA